METKVKSEMEEKLNTYKVGSLPSIFYVPNFISDSEECRLIERINSAPMSKWKSLKNRRLQNWGGVVHEKGLISQSLPSWLTSITEKICDLTGLFPSPINHVLVNEYAPGQGIMPHQDGPAYFPVVAILSLGSPAIMTFTPHMRLKMHEAEGVKEKGEIKDISVAMMPRSLLIFKDSAYQDYLHGIDECSIHQFDEIINMKSLSRDSSEELPDQNLHDNTNFEIPALGTNMLARTGTRLSLTCRLVPKVNKSLIKL